MRTKEEIAAYKKEWKRLNWERLSKKDAEYRKENSERMKPYFKKRYESNKEDILKKQKERYVRNYSVIRERQNKWSYTPNGIYSSYKSRAKQDSLQFHITMDEFMAFWQKPCHYCWQQVDRIGLDRVDNEKGYIVSNLVSCCKICNWMKRDMSQKDFLVHVRSVAAHFAIEQEKV